MKNNMNNFINSLQRVIDFFNNVPNGNSWVVILTKIKSDIINQDTRREALNLLNDYFGGMGSLNDMVFCEGNKNIPEGYNEKQTNKEFEILLDKLFKEYKLFEGSIWDRIKWSYKEFNNRKNPPLRVLNAFNRQ